MTKKKRKSKSLTYSRTYYEYPYKEVTVFEIDDPYLAEYDSSFSSVEEAISDDLVNTLSDLQYNEELLKLQRKHTNAKDSHILSTRGRISYLKKRLQALFSYKVKKSPLIKYKCEC